MAGLCTAHRNYFSGCPACEASRKAQPTAHEAERAFATFYADQKNRPFDDRAAFLAGYRRGRAESCEAWIVIEKQIAALRAENARLRAFQHDSGCPAVADDESDAVLHDYGVCVCWRAKLAAAEKDVADYGQIAADAQRAVWAAEQREKRLREAAKRVEPILNALRRDNEIRGYDQPEIRDAHDRLRAALAEGGK